MLEVRLRLILVALALVFCLGIPVNAQAPRQPAAAPGPWIDVHLHLVPGLIGRSRTDFAGAVQTALRDMDELGIAVAIVLPPPQVDGQERYDHEAFTSALERHRGRFAFMGGGGSLNAILHRHADPAQVSDAVRRDFAAAAEKIIDAGAAGFGEMAALHMSAVQGHPFESVSADHPLLLVLADVAARRDVPIDLHMDAAEGDTPTPPRFSVPPNPPRLADTIGGLERLLRHNPKARIVWAHGGSDPIGGQSPATIARLMDAHPNLFVSLRIVGGGAQNMQHRALRDGDLEPGWRALLTRHPDRFVIGTDSFMLAPTVRGGGPATQFAERNAQKLRATTLFLSLLPPEVANKISSENAARIYRLPRG
jgi:predicted TIM-barrel fold metal-dependent hydrolase